MKAGTRTLSSQLHQELRRRIMTGEYPQGMRLTEQPIAEEMQVSRVPLREAIPLLEAEGLVRNVPRQGAVVRTWSLQDVDDLFDVRLALESRACLLAAKRVALGAPADQLWSAYHVAESMVHSGNVLERSIVNVRYHQVLVSLAGNALLDSLMQAVAARMTWLFYLTAQHDTVAACSEHLSITRAVADGQGLLARALTEAHIEGGRRPTYRVLESSLEGA